MKWNKDIEYILICVFIIAVFVFWDRSRRQLAHMGNQVLLPVDRVPNTLLDTLLHIQNQ